MFLCVASQHQIKELRSVRLQYQELETSYTMAKTTYENAAAGLEAERLRLEQECNNLQARARYCAVLVAARVSCLSPVSSRRAVFV